jgi:poly(A) polymerase
MAVVILRRLRFPRAEVERVAELVRHHLRFIDVKRMRESTLKRFLRMEGFAEHLELHRLDCLASHGNLENYEYARVQLERLSPEELKPAPLISGQDLIHAGYLPGPSFRRILEAVETAQLESRAMSPEEALAFVRSHYLPPDGRPANGSVTQDDR